ncbi:phosphoglycerate dehydrogenase-like enzyme [Streptosporangium becharense]|uniref:Phosphoglycerate dehydrogenase-like enzyme n=1 Tax=Streptosporangium becharense TaxID=1816182 RepID=A0A7W9IJ48_9ACTN|nr:D-isomer specific 2-hydroxyacid dehydrogenase family protein [Streptosporangium becharense]MBB2911285.1 phosphoglycerate dehydrogenase-like enzyme [Streptosporangium becharense]MBB5821657.1 phosphoglycerate dehydrogenase-like enzyme [Streptosporangium becharense]
MDARIAIAPSPEMGAAYDRPNSPALGRLRARVEEAVAAGGGAVVAPGEANGLVWLIPGEPEPLRSLLDDHPGIGWVQFPWAGVERFAVTDVFHRPVTFTCAKGSFAGQVAEHALMLMLACLRNLARQARTPRWHPIDPVSLGGRRVTILGGGGIAAELVRILRPFDCRLTVVRRRPEKVEGADETLSSSALHSVLPETDILVLALALTAETRHVVGAAELALLPQHAAVVNVARGAHIDTGALVEALRAGTISAAGLDVTDPEPLPEGHPLWDDPRVLITSHCADSAEYVTRMFCERVERNVRNLREGRPLEGAIDPAAGY